MQLVALLLRHDCARDAAQDDRASPPEDPGRSRVLLRSRWPAAAPIVAAAARTLLRSGMPAIDIAADLPGSDRAALEAEAATGCPATLRFVSGQTAGHGYTAVVTVEPIGGPHEDPGEVTIPAFVGDGVVVIGPAAGADAGPCPACTRRRLLANRDPGAAAPAAPDVARAAIAGTLLGAEVLATVRAGRPHRPSPAVLVLDLATCETHRERLLPHPGCDHPGGLAGFTDDATAADLVAPHVGVLAGFTDDAAAQLPLRVGAVRLAHPAQTVVAYDPSTVDAARDAAVRAAVARYAEAVLPDRPLRWTPARTPFTGSRNTAPEGPSRAGVGVGAGLADAVTAGLCHVLADDAARTGPGRPVEPVALYAGASRPDTLEILVRTAARAGLPVRLSVPADAAIPVVVARAPRSTPAVGWGDDLAAAATQALLSLLGPRQLAGDGWPQPVLDTGALLPAVERWLREQHRDAWFADITPVDIGRTGLTVVRALLMYRRPES
ncbi:TOMM precursor leader peptide-binding protein [Dactylosporangium sp. NPDC005555]|uniref:TOMM precursor leader peptide-binding protein n=1 Tax=Dactylosporangium sp. NPDC005555 TaxID=3154889 RepID=UPI0033AE861B